MKNWIYPLICVIIAVVVIGIVVWLDTLIATSSMPLWLKIFLLK